MKRTILIIGSFLLIGILGTSVFMTSCKKKKEPAPEIPPVSTFQMEYALNASDTTSKANATYCNFGKGAINVWVWNTVIGLNMAIPVAAFVECFNHEAVYDPDEENWTWTYDYTWALATYTAKLVASMNGNYVHWEMFISKSGAYTDVLWYEGDSKTDGTEGTWSLNYQPLNPKPLVDIIWHRNATAGTADIKYTNAIPGNPGNGGYIHYGVTADPDFDAFYTIYFIEQLRTIDIEWNRTSKDGRIKDTKQTNCWGTILEADTWQCWDTAYADVDCTP